ncbi:hypothetical protein HYH03_010299 [Edaphochlamys debaryana]|uniref:Uncharacterized protein n=1 Tax=Edaphochlamys debaryana TaxID=47281 RepID=A0A836BXJ6_9CHLO|nr:hypothetical protein HYH03_010299 [Edaphochlamys debaryana]|eukprot:KAG2491293.1 hypothetical protein HYH03_010299 [Edaphochlamys debaryana]
MADAALSLNVQLACPDASPAEPSTRCIAPACSYRAQEFGSFGALGDRVLKDLTAAGLLSFGGHESAYVSFYKWVSLHRRCLRRSLDASLPACTDNVFDTCTDDWRTLDSYAILSPAIEIQVATSMRGPDEAGSLIFGRSASMTRQAVSFESEAEGAELGFMSEPSLAVGSADSSLPSALRASRDGRMSIDGRPRASVDGRPRVSFDGAFRRSCDGRRSINGGGVGVGGVLLLPMGPGGVLDARSSYRC